MLGNKDIQALSFHRTIFAPLKSTQDSSRSAHSLFLHRAFDRRMALHFLLAVSHHELAIYQDRSHDPPQESCLHYRRGTELLQQQTQAHKTTPNDHLNMMLSFLYMYLFWMRRSRLDPIKIRALSKIVYVYMRDSDLNDLCSLREPPLPLTHSYPGLAIATSDQILLARTIIYLYDRDGFCSFFGCGGTLAEFVTGMPEKRHALWQISRIPFLWPMTDMDLSTTSDMPDEDRTILDVYFELIILHQEINRLSQGFVESPDEAWTKLRQRLDLLKQGASFITFLVEDKDLRSTKSLMAYVTSTVFYATCIYLDRATVPGFGGPRSSSTDQALSSLLKVSYKTVSMGSVQLLERFQWALLIAGIETSDEIHRHWVISSISDMGIRDIFRVILDEKFRLGGVISMRDIRQLIGKS
ncbi:hypothetical protein FE257_005633 [Aspergillus nanangensis]|uniref:Uncharacterized protein n=1 Tax=Aspergillus nanangensis TaxID=2582783 RepID=A0AAD4CQB8_ASPNN|nr:hypothetical protein FE257_005633 [Aspergillus nanangensis]